MVQRAGLLVVAVLSAIVSLAGVAAAKEPDGYSCGTGGKRNLAKERCECPKGNVAKRDADNIAVCVAKPKTKAAKYLDDVVELAASGDLDTAFTCARTKAGVVSCWGGLFKTSTPFVVTGIGKATALAASWTTACAAVAEGKLWCWGADGKPVESDLGLDLIELTMGDEHRCGRTRDGEVFCWGDNYNGELGDGSRTDSSEPVQVTGLTDVVQVVAGHNHTCARTKDRKVWCWGGFALREGDEIKGPWFTPVLIDGLAPAVNLDVRRDLSCAAQANGRLACWGQRFSDGGMVEELRPAELEGLSRIVEVSAGNPLCARSKRKVHCWASTAEDPAEHWEPVSDLSSAVALEAGLYSGCARMKNGEVRCWGNSHRVRGDGKDDNDPSLGTWESSRVVAPPAN